MKAAPSASLEVPEADLLLEFLIIPFDAPSELGLVDEIDELGVIRQG